MKRLPGIIGRAARSRSRFLNWWLLKMNRKKPESEAEANNRLGGLITSSTMWCSHEKRKSRLCQERCDGLMV